MSALRDVIARMAVDSEFARHARANPDRVAREHGLTADEAAKLRGLADAGSGGGPMALGARLSKSGIGTGGFAAAAAELIGDASAEEVPEEPPEESPLSGPSNQLGEMIKTMEEESQLELPGQPVLQLGAQDGITEALHQPPYDPFVSGEGDDSGSQEQPSMEDLLNQPHDSSVKIPGLLPEDTEDGAGGPEQPGGGTPELSEDYPTFPGLEKVPDGPVPEGGGQAETPAGPAAEETPPGGGQPAAPPSPAADQPAPAYQPPVTTPGPAAAGPVPGPAPAGIGGVSGQAQSLLPVGPAAGQPQPGGSTGIGAAGIGAAGIAIGAAGAVAGGVAGGIGGAAKQLARRPATRPPATLPRRRTPQRQPPTRPTDRPGRAGYRCPPGPTGLPSHRRGSRCCAPPAACICTGLIRTACTAAPPAGTSG
jgi:hypothetical protein